MTDEEKVSKFHEIQGRLWSMATDGNMLQSTIASAIIRELEIVSPEGEDTENA